MHPLIAAHFHLCFQWTVVSRSGETARSSRALYEVNLPSLAEEVASSHIYVRELLPASGTNTPPTPKVAHLALSDPSAVHFVASLKQFVPKDHWLFRGLSYRVGDIDFRLMALYRGTSPNVLGYFMEVCVCGSLLFLSAFSFVCFAS